MAYSEAVERWRPLVAKYFPAELVDKALYVIQGESGGNPGAVGDGGAARGLFQIQDKTNFANRPDAAFLDDPENNVRYAAQQLGAASGNFGAWGEGTSNNGAKFGALGNNPYPGDGSGGTMSGPGGGSDWTTSYSTTYAKWAPLDDKYRQANELGAEWDPEQGFVTGRQVDDLGNVTNPGKPLMTPQEYSDYVALDRQLGDLEDEYQNQGGAESLGDAISRATFNYKTDPRNIDAANSADKFNRELDVRQLAASVAGQQLTNQHQVQNDAEDSFNKFVSTSSWGQTFRAPSTNLPTADDLFAKAVDAVKKGMPDVTDAPYYDQGPLPGSAASKPSLGAARRAATTYQGRPPEDISGALGQLPTDNGMPPSAIAPTPPTPTNSMPNPWDSRPGTIQRSNPWDAHTARATNIQPFGAKQAAVKVNSGLRGSIFRF